MQERDPDSFPFPLTTEDCAAPIATVETSAPAPPQLPSQNSPLSTIYESGNASHIGITHSLSTPPWGLETPPPYRSPPSYAEVPRASDLSFKHPADITPASTIGSSSKRPYNVAFSDQSAGSNSGEAPSKLQKTARPQHSLDKSYFQREPLKSFSEPSQTPQSPLFFSNDRYRRPHLPERFSSSDAGVTMLNQAREEKKGSPNVKTLKLARGVFHGGSPSRHSNTPSDRASTERRSLSDSITPDALGRNVSTQLIHEIGIVELLEQDDRPTFILDLSNECNYGVGTWKVAFANAALRAHQALVDAVLGASVDDDMGLSKTVSFAEFKAWTTSYVKNRESLDVALPSFAYMGMSWTAYTLRKRFRVISCVTTHVLALHSTISENPPSSSGSFLNDQLREQGKLMGGEKIMSPSRSREAQDYFGNAGLRNRDANSSNVTSGSNSRSNEASYILPVPQQSSSTDSTHAENRPSSSKPTTPNLDLHLSPRSAPAGFFDWTRLPDSPLLPKHVRFTRNTDWSRTALGPINSWGTDLRFMCNLLMASPNPGAMYWGPEYVTLYNESYINLIGLKHPKLMSMRYEDAWPELWGDLKSVFEDGQERGLSIMKEDDHLMIKRNDFLEETFYSWSIIPLVGADGSVAGLYNPAFENTRRKIAERRMLTLREVGEKTAAARDVKSFWGQVLAGLKYNEYDTPFVILYSVTDDSDSDVSSIHSSSLNAAKICVFEGALGVPDDHPSAPTPLDLRSSNAGFCKYFRESMKTDKPIVLTLEDGPVDPEMFDGIQWRGFGDPCRYVAICPIHQAAGDSALGYLVLGLNPRRPYDDDYRLFIELLSRQLATSMASVVLFEAEIRRGQKAARMAALDKLALHSQLEARTQEAIDSELKFSRMAEFVPVGIFIADSTGEINYCNDEFYEISRHPREVGSTNTWMDSIKAEDRDIFHRMWARVVEDKQVAKAEFRFKTSWQDKGGIRGETWALASAFPERNRDGTLKSVFGSLTNISQQKWAEDIQKKRMEEAVELKRQQENFIDITSHEMRNPLSAILQCADEISLSLADKRVSQPSLTFGSELVESTIDAAQTIALCAQHQKRIVDDILTLSKLDSALLLVTPVHAQPISVIQRSLKMFEGEFGTHDIEVGLEVDSSYDMLGINWVRMDPSRLLQVLINLITNAIKFTGGEQSRSIVIVLGASLTPPSAHRDSSRRVAYIPRRSEDRDPTTAPEWGEGEQIFLEFAVRDTGKGLSDDETKLLFKRFKQASPRTHVQYGGSGLGLFICRELTELQGGQIGVASQKDVGSTFAFYVKARRSAPPDDAHELAASNSNSSLHTNAAVSRKLSIKRNSMHKSSSSDFGLDSASASPTAPTVAMTLTPPSMSEAPSHIPSSRPAPPLPPIPTLDPKTLKVLIVEDNLVNQRVLQKQLKNLGCTVAVANHGGEALDYLRTTVFWRDKTNGKPLSVILMDLEMPVMDGLTATKAIRSLEAEGKIVGSVPIIAVTANARSEQIATALASGMDDVVSKPFRIPELIPKIAELTTRQSQQ